LISATLVAATLIHWFDVDLIVVLVAWLTVCIPFIPSSFRADRLSRECYRSRWLMASRSAWVMGIGEAERWEAGA
jgi:hypothetical protein